MVKVLVTGFGPFPGMAENRSARVVQGFVASCELQAHEIHRRVLPTTYDDSECLIRELITSLMPDLCICLGVARTPTIRLERLARNATSACSPDAAGQLRSGPIVATGPAAYPSS